VRFVLDFTSYNGLRRELNLDLDCLAKLLLYTVQLDYLLHDISISLLRQVFEPQYTLFMFPEYSILFSIIAKNNVSYNRIVKAQGVR
jgi:hypothetical protein